METRAHYVVIGSVVLIAIALAFYIIIQMSQTSREFDEYDVIFTERVSGLSVGAAVRFNGIQKGTVETLSIDADAPRIVVARPFRLRGASIRFRRHHRQGEPAVVR